MKELNMIKDNEKRERIEKIENKKPELTEMLEENEKKRPVKKKKENCQCGCNLF